MASRTSKFRDLPLEQRQNESKRVLSKHENKVPVIIEPATEQQPKLKTGAKHLVPTDMNVQSLLFFVRRSLPELQAHEALWLFVESQSAESKKSVATLVPTTSTVGAVYADHKSPDGFLYLVYSLENTFGC